MINNEIALNVVSKQRSVFWKLSQISKFSSHVTDSQSVCLSWLRATTETHSNTPLNPTPIKRLIRFYYYENNQQDALYRLIYYSKSALHVSGDVFVHHQEHLTVFTLSGSVHPSAPDDGQKHRPKHVQLTWNNKLTLNLLAPTTVGARINP